MTPIVPPTIAHVGVEDFELVASEVLGSEVGELLPVVIVTVIAGLVNDCVDGIKDELDVLVGDAPMVKVISFMEAVSRDPSATDKTIVSIRRIGAVPCCCEHASRGRNRLIHEVRAHLKIYGSAAQEASQVAMFE